MTSSGNNEQGMKFGLIFFSSSEPTLNDDKYRLVIESVKFADQHGFSSVWIPERHFTRDGWLYPNPAVLQAALARETKHIGLRAGSVVMPLHNPIRVAEEWAMVDNLSRGRVGVSFASGWHSNDFVFFPEKYAGRHEEMYRGIETVQKLWRGEPLMANGGDGQEVAVRVFPTPVQPTLPIWLTAAGNPRTFAKAGEIGANLLTHMFNQSLEELAERINIYRQARARHGHDAAAGQVTLMLHTFIGAERDLALEQARTHFCEYLKSATYLLNAIASSRGQNIDFTALSASDLNDYMHFVFDRLISTDRVLFGTPQSCSGVVAQLSAIGVDEVACQLDFGADAEQVLASMPYLNQLKNECQSPAFLLRAAELSRTRETSYNKNNFSTVDAEEKGPSSARPRPQESIQQIQARCSEEVAVTDFYERLHRVGVQLGARFRGIESLRRHDGEALGQVQLPAPLEHEAQSYHLHPAFLDAALQVLMAALPAQTMLTIADSLYLFVGLRRFEVHGQPGRRIWSHALLRSDTTPTNDTFEGDVRLLDDEAKLLVEISGLRLRRVESMLSSPGRHQNGGSRESAEAALGAAPPKHLLISAVPEERQRLLETYLRQSVASVLRLPMHKVHVHEPLNNLGIDSLMAVELKRQIEVDLGVALRIVHFLLGHSVAHLAEQVGERLRSAETPESSLVKPPSADELLANIDELSDADVESLLHGLLADEEVTN